MRKLLEYTTSFSILLLVFIAFFHKTAELSLDLGEHLVFGKQIVTAHKFMQTNTFSYTFPNFPFIHHEFIPDALFYAMYHAFGINSLIVFTAILVTASFTLLFFYSYKKANKLVLFSASFIYIRILLERTYVRPEIFSYFFLAVTTVILLTYLRRFTKWIYVLIPLQFLWVNSHIYFIFGIFLTACLLIEMIVTKQFRTRSKDVMVLSVVLIASIFVSVLNPNGIAGVLYPFTVFNNYGYSVAENNSIFVIEQLFAGRIVYSILFFKIAAVSLVALLFITIKNRAIFAWIISAVFIILATTAIRNFPLFVFGTFIPFVILGSKGVEHIIHKLPSSVHPVTKFLPVYLEISLLITFLIHIPFVWTVQGGGLGTNDAAMRGVNFFIQHHIPGPIFNNYGIGSYLVFRLYPQEKVFVDARPEAYPATFFQQIYVPMQSSPALFAQVSKKYKFNAILFDYPSEQTNASRLLLKYLANNPDWKMIYLDDTVVIFVKNTNKNASLIQAHAISQTSYSLEQYAANESSLENLAYFFNSVGWEELEQKTYSQILNIDPNNCNALASQIVYLAAKNDSGVQILQFRYQSLCKQ